MTTQGVSRSPSLEELLRIAIESYIEEIHTSMPARVVSFDPEDQRVEVQPLVERLVETEDGGEICETLPPITDVPVVFPRTKNFVVSFPIEEGDIVLLMFTERSIDKWLSTADGAITNPNDFLRHDLSNAVAIPGVYPFSQPITNFDNEALTIGQDGSTIVRVKKDLIELGTKGSTDKASLDSKVQIELKALRSTLASLVTDFNAHNHAVTTAPGTTGTPSTGTPPTTAIAPATVAATNSALVTLEK